MDGGNGSTDYSTPARSRSRREANLTRSGGSSRRINIGQLFGEGNGSELPDERRAVVGSSIASVVDLMDDVDMEQEKKRRAGSSFDVESVTSENSVSGGTHLDGMARRRQEVKSAREKRRIRREEKKARMEELARKAAEEPLVEEEPEPEIVVGESGKPWYAYGNWVGPGWSDGQAQDSVAEASVGVVDDYDATGRTHDLAYGRREDRGAADLEFFRDNIGRSVPGDAYHTVHRNVAAVGVGGQGLARYVYGNRYDDVPRDSLARFGEWFAPNVEENEDQAVVVTFGDRITREAKRRIEASREVRNEKSVKQNDGEPSNRNKPEDVLPSRRPYSEVEVAPSGHLRGGKVPRRDWFDEL